MSFDSDDGRVGTDEALTCYFCFALALFIGGCTIIWSLDA